MFIHIYVNIYGCTYTDIYIYIYKVKLATVVERDPKASFQIATTQRC